MTQRGETRWAYHGDVRIAYELHGGFGPWLVLVHGLDDGRWGWEPVLAGLAERFRVLAIDNRGVGESDAPPGPYSTEQMAGDVLAVLDHAGAQRAHVIGVSGGGMVAQQLAIAAPERVERLVLACTTPGGADAYPMPEEALRLIEQAAWLPPTEVLRRLVENALSDRTRRTHPELVERLLAHRLETPQDPAAWQAQAAAFAWHDPGGALTRIVAPTLVLHGTDDAVVDHGNAGLLAARIPDAAGVDFEGCGHLLHWEEPERFVAVVTAFLRGAPL